VITIGGTGAEGGGSAVGLGGAGSGFGSGRGFGGTSTTFGGILVSSFLVRAVNSIPREINPQSEAAIAIDQNAR